MIPCACGDESRLRQGRSQPTTDFRWQGTWRSTFLGQDQSREPSVDCSDVYSDLLHRPNFCAHVHLLHYTQNIPPANEIARLQDLTVEEFEAKWVDRPFILTQPVKQWKVYRDWSIEYLRDRYKEVGFRAESVDWPLGTYMDYLSSSSDESPLYLFDRDFADKMKLKITDEKDGTADYWPPTCFGFDAFSVLGEERPDHRWLIVGPPRSGSTFHKDPNATSAWNAVIRGSKYWIMFRSSPAIPPPPGVFVSADQSEVTSPLSIAEWLLGYHAEARRTPGCREGVCHEGEVLYVPSGWYHLVLNMETSIALTQNFVPPARVGSILQFLRDQRQSVSGFSAAVADPFQLFLDRLRAWDPRLLEHGLEDLGRLTGSTKTRWERAVEIKQESEVGQGGEFSFGFEAFEGDEAA